MSATVVRCEQLGKRYRIGTAAAPYGRLTESLTRAATAPLRLAQRRPRSTAPAGEQIWALRDVSLEISDGEVVGIVGRNGAGKTTLLKLLSRITEPTTGRAVLRGRVGSLLEVGTGFHPELTGRENIFLNGAILGMRRSEIIRKFDEIVEFADIGRFLDTPVKRYSSGMYVRLAFAVAAHLEPEILIVDEVLAVGDAGFQRKCLGKMSAVAHEGRTVLFVSHNMHAVKSLCTRAVHLEGGHLISDGDAGEIVLEYLRANESLPAERVWDDPAERPGDDHCRLVAVRVLDELGEHASAVLSSAPTTIELEFELSALHDAFHAGFDLATAEGTVVFRTFNTDASEERQVPLRIGRNVLRCTIPPGLLNSGTYTVLPRIGLHFIRWIVNPEDPAVMFDVTSDHIETTFVASTTRPGPVAPALEWRSADDSGTPGGAAARGLELRG